MATYLGLKGFKFLRKFFFLPLLHLLFCSFSAMGGQTNLGSKEIIITDTVPGNQLYNIERNNVRTLFAMNGVLIAKLNNGDSLVIRRKEYESFAKKNAEPGESLPTFTKVEIEPEYPGGAHAWSTYVKENIQHSTEAIANNFQGTVIVQFIVEQDGTLTDIEAVSGPTTAGLRQEAIRLVKMSGKWNTAIQSFRIVRAYKKQAVIFATEKK